MYTSSPESTYGSKVSGWILCQEVVLTTLYLSPFNHLHKFSVKTNTIPILVFMKRVFFFKQQETTPQQHNTTTTQQHNDTKPHQHNTTPTQHKNNKTPFFLGGGFGCRIGECGAAPKQSRQTDRVTDKLTSQLYDQLGPEGRVPAKEMPQPQPRSQPGLDQDQDIGGRRTMRGTSAVNSRGTAFHMPSHCSTQKV